MYVRGSVGVQTFEFQNCDWFSYLYSFFIFFFFPLLREIDTGKSVRPANGIFCPFSRTLRGESHTYIRRIENGLFARVYWVDQFSGQTRIRQEKA
jgi:hypothetical protein